MEPKEKTTPKKMPSILYEHVHGKLGFGSESPFRLMPNFSTPPTRFTKIFNPFEAHLNERLHLPVFSPSVFTTTSSPKSDEKFKWTIDDISMLKPADIDPTLLQECEEHDSVTELKAQEKINKFFSEVIVPSPMNQPPVVQPLISDASSPSSSDKQMCDVAVQTTLSLPLTLPKHVEDILKPYLQTNCDEEGNEDLYKKLFEFEEQRTPESVRTSPARSVGLSPLEMSPLECQHNHEERRNSGVTCGTPPVLRECNLSPIRLSRAEMPRDRRFISRLDFSSNMSVDSIVLVPDSCEALPKNNSLTLDYCSSPPRQELSTASMNWDLEYKHVSLAHDSATDMDVSNSNTPRSKIFCSQRKKLSDSFIREDFENDLKEGVVEVVQRGIPCKRMLVREDTDVGYQTGSILLSEDSTWSSNAHLFASTPTKNKKQNSI